MGRISLVLSILLTSGCDETPPDRDDCSKVVARESSYEQVDPGYAFTFVAGRPDCFAGRDGEDGLRRLMRVGAESTLVHLLRDRRSEISNSDSFAAACGLYAVPYPSLKLTPLDAGDAGTALCVYADAQSETANGLASAMEGTEQIASASLRADVRKDIVASAYALFYLNRLKRTDVYAFSEFREKYPLREFVAPMDFARELGARMGKTPLPYALVVGEGLDEIETRTLVAERFAAVTTAHNAGEAVVLGDAFVRDGYDAALVYDVLYRYLTNGRSYVLALRVAREHLDEKAVRAVEDARIAELESAGRYSIVVGPDGRRSKAYPMWDDE